jgi:hypothetical protein
MPPQEREASQQYSRFDFARIQAFAPLVLAIEFEEVKRIYRNTDAHAVRSLAA